MQGQLQASQVSELSIPGCSLHSCENRKAAPSTNTGGAGRDGNLWLITNKIPLSLSFFSVIQLPSFRPLPVFLHYLCCFGSRCYLSSSSSSLFLCVCLCLFSSCGSDSCGCGTRDTRRAGPGFVFNNSLLLLIMRLCECVCEST